MTHIRSVRFFSTLVAFLAAAFFMLAGQADAYSYYQPVFTPYYQYQSYRQPVYYQYQSYGNTAALQSQLRALQSQLLILQQRYQTVYGYSYGSRGHSYTRPYERHYNYDDYDIDVETLRARNIEDDEATLYGEIDLGDADYAYVWFEYGENGRLNEETDKERIDDDDNETFRIEVDDLDEDERYYYRAIAEAPNGDWSYGEIKSFTSDEDGGSSHDDDEPVAETGDAEDVTDDNADITGEVDMNDFNNGIVFFVWGEDEDEVEDVEDEDEYNDIDEQGDDLQKEKVDNDLDGEENYLLFIEDLDDNTDYYFRICVEYEDEDDDETLVCGDVEEFETD